jgi:DNA-binding phage protein
MKKAKGKSKSSSPVRIQVPAPVGTFTAKTVDFNPSDNNSVDLVSSCFRDWLASYKISVSAVSRKSGVCRQTVVRFISPDLSKRGAVNFKTAMRILFGCGFRFSLGVPEPEGFLF